jgi:hypothetical protein
MEEDDSMQYHFVYFAPLSLPIEAPSSNIWTQKRWLLNGVVEFLQGEDFRASAYYSWPFGTLGQRKCVLPAPGLPEYVNRYLCEIVDLQSARQVNANARREFKGVSRMISCRHSLGSVRREAIEVEGQEIIFRLAMGQMRITFEFFYKWWNEDGERFNVPLDVKKKRLYCHVRRPCIETSLFPATASLYIQSSTWYKTTFLI